MAKNVTQKLIESHWVEGRINPREEIGLPRFARPQRVRKTEPVLAYFVVSENQEVVMALTIKPEKLLINHEWVEAQNGKRFDVVNPVTEQKITDVAEGDKADADSAVRVAREAAIWRNNENCWPGLSGISLLKNPLRLTHCYTRRTGR